MSEKQDSKGTIITAEYMNKFALRAFLSSQETQRYGVLQRFVPPRLCHDIEDVSHDLLVHYYNGDVTVERRRGVYSLEMAPHPTLGCNTLPPIPVEGKMQTCATMPFQPTDCRRSRIERIQDSALLTACRDVCSEVRLSVEGYRLWEAHHLGLSSEEMAEAGGRGLRSFTLQMRVGRADRQLYLIGLLGMRYPATRRRGEVSFHMTNCLAVEDAPIAAPFPHEFDFPPVKAPVSSVPDGDQTGLAEMFAFLKTEKPVLRYAVFDGEHYLCPNCDVMHAKEKFVRMTYAELAEHYFTHSANGKHELKAIFPPHKKSIQPTAGGVTPLKESRAAPPLSRPSTAGKQRPLSARSNAPSQVAAAGSHPVEIVWKSIPPVLQKLNVSLADLVRSKTRLAQSAALCDKCATKFGAVLASGSSGQVDAEGRSSPTRRGVSPIFGLAVPQRPASARTNSARPPSATGRESEVIDQIVVTDLQSRHRAMRQAERAAYDAQLAQQPVRPLPQEIEHQRRQLQLEEEVGQLLESFTMQGEKVVHAPSPSPERSPHSSQLPAVSPPRGQAPSEWTEILQFGPGADVPLQMLLCSELYYCMVDACAASSSTRGGSSSDLLFTPAPKKGTAYYSLLQRGFPKPPLLVPTDDLRPLSEQRAAELESEYLSSSRKAASKVLRKVSTTFADLSEAERIFLVDVVGTDFPPSVEITSSNPERQSEQDVSRVDVS